MPGQRLAQSGDHFDGFVGLQRADDPRQHTNHASLFAVLRQARGRRLGIEVAVGQTVGVFGAGVVEHRHLPLKLEDRTIDERNLRKLASIVDRVLGREVVSPVQYQVVARHQLTQQLGVCEPRDRLDTDVRVHGIPPRRSNVHLLLADAGAVKQHLAM